MGDATINHSSMNKVAAVSSSSRSDDDEESGWTSYFEDFSNNYNRDRDRKSLCSSFDSSSVVSDAASFPAWKSSSSSSSNYNHVLAASPSSMLKGSPDMPINKLTFDKKTRAEEISHDDSLEDTASSPVTSPKVSDLGPIEAMNLKKTNDYFNSSLGKEGSSEHYGRSEIDFNEKNSDYTDLKKKGLCLVPLSMDLQHRM